MKRILCLILTLVLSLSAMFCLASCGGDNDKTNGETNNESGNNDSGTEEEKVTYTITALDDRGNPVKGVKVALRIGDNNPIEFLTDAEGKITQKTSKKITAQVTAFPENYAYDKTSKVQSFDADGNLKLTFKYVELDIEEFKIKVVDQDDNPVEGVTVQICDAKGSCRVPQETDENGEAFYPVEEGTFYASLTNGLDALPEGYTVADPEAKYYFENNEVTIKIEKNN